MTEKNILFIVEGEVTEYKFFSQLNRCFDLSANIFSYKTNIFSLYEEVKKLDFEADIIKILRKSAKTDEERKILNKKFYLIYLIFDYEIQHNSSHGVFSNETLVNNFKKLIDLLNVFDNETDPTKGKLYINFPMFESYKDIDSFEDMNYLNRICKLSDIKNYKKNVGERKIANINIKNFTKNNYVSLAKLNLLKINFIINKIHFKPSYHEYLKINLKDVTDKENELALSRNEIYVLNTSCLFILDFLGNENGFYDSI